MEELYQYEQEQAAPEIPDGIGLRLDDVRMLIAREHDVQPPDKGDPMLLVVTMMNACLAEQQKLHERHCKAVTKVLGEKTDAYVRGVREAVPMPPAWNS